MVEKLMLKNVPTLPRSFTFGACLALCWLLMVRHTTPALGWMILVIRMISVTSVLNTFWVCRVCSSTLVTIRKSWREDQNKKERKLIDSKSLAFDKETTPTVTCRIEWVCVQNYQVGIKNKLKRFLHIRSSLTYRITNFNANIIKFLLSNFNVLVLL